MTLSAGTRIGPYEIIGPLGAGGMGEVYRARDVKLGRHVAIKLLPPLFAADPERVARFEREARTLATLNHPHIAQVYGFEQSPAGCALVMELVEGEDLAERIARGPVPPAEALAIAQQIASGLEAAHSIGVIHRDLKPANIKLRPDGTVKVLDFGLAKPLDDRGSVSATGQDPLNSPTLTSPAATMKGVVLGTAAYMSPEQARGRPIDQRADIWAFGVVLYEMLSGGQAFTGETVSDTIAAILTREPDLESLPKEVSPTFRYVLARCLAKDASRRFHHIADARLELERSDIPAVLAAATAPARRGFLIAGAVLAILATAGTATGWWFLASHGRERRRYSFTVPAAGFNGVSQSAISKDGRWLVYSRVSDAAPFRLFIRSLESFETRELASSSTTGLSPFFSADARWVAFFNQSGLYKVPVEGGTAERIADILPTNAEGTWASDGTIIIASQFRTSEGVRRPLIRIRPGSGAGEAITTAAPGEAHRDPYLLPGERHLLLTVATAQSASIAAVDLVGGTLRRILPDARRPRYSPDGYLLFQRESSGDLMAVAFDPGRLQTSGEAVRIDRIAQVADWPAYDLSAEGTLIYSTPEDAPGDGGFTVVAVDRSGRETTLLADESSWASPRMSRDRRSLLLREIMSPNCNLWLVDLVRGLRTRLVYPADNHEPIWRADGFIAWGAQSETVRNIRLARPDRIAQAVELGSAAFERTPDSWSPDGTLLALTESHATNGDDLLILALKSNEVRAFAATSANERQGQFSPDGQWMAFVSDESGRPEVYVQRLDPDGERVQISSGGGHSPRWGPAGRELFFVEDVRLMAVETDLRRQPVRISAPRRLLEGPYVWERLGNYDVSADGTQFVFVKRTGSRDRDSTLRVILNWRPPQLQPAR